MNNIFIEEIRHQVKKALKNDKKRYRHSLGVANTAACLAMRYNIDMERAYLAGLLHDCAKCEEDAIMIKVCEDRNIPVSDIERENPYLLHAKVGAVYAKEIYNINDDEIISAIACHTTGKADMTMLEMVIFTADYIEPYRDKAANLDRIRNEAFKNINIAVTSILKDTLDYLKKSNKSIDESTQITYEFYKNML